MCGRRRGRGAGHDQCCPPNPRHAPKHVECFRSLRCADHGDVLLDDARLLKRNLLEAVAQQVHVIHTQRRDHRHEGRHDIGRIEAAAESHFQHGHIDLFARKEHESQRRDDLEPRQSFHGVEVGFELIDELRELFSGDVFAVHLHSLAERMQMRRNIKAGAIPGRSQTGFDHRRRRAFAFCARDMNGAISPIGPPQSIEQLVDPIEAPRFRRVALRLRALVIDELIEIGKGLGVATHLSTPWRAHSARRAAQPQAGTRRERNAVKSTLVTPMLR